MTSPTIQAGKRATYPAYKPSGMDWVGDVPKHWDMRRLKYTASINDEALPETTDPDYEFTYVDIGSVDAFKGIVATETYRFEDAPSRARRIVRQGDTVVSTVRTYLRAIAAIREPAENLIVSTGFAVVRPRSLDPGYLSYALRSPFFVETVVSRSTGVSYPAINAPEVGNIDVTLPPLDEQKAIAAFLDRETARIDALIEKKRRQIELLQEKRSALISHAVTKGLDPNAPMRDSGIEWLGQIPEHWETVRVRHVITRLEQGWSPQCEGREAGPDEWGIMKAGCANYGRFNEHEHKALPGHVEPEEMYEIRAGDVVMSRACGTVSLVGSVAYVERCRPRLLLCDKLFRLHTNRDLCDPQYLYLALNSRSTRAQIEISVSGADGLANNITQPTIKNIVIGLPPLDEQHEIVTSVRVARLMVDALVTRVERSIALLREHRTALISAAVTGKVDVRGEVTL